VNGASALWPPPAKPRAVGSRHGIIGPGGIPDNKKSDRIFQAHCGCEPLTVTSRRLIG
jgi:hypothetical protein